MAHPHRLGRRAFLAGTTAALAGCSRAREVVDGRPSSQPVSVTIKTTPADDDPYAIRIARHLATNLEAAGVAAQIVPMATDELLRDLLINHEFDIYVARHPGGHDPDFLRSLVHSKYGNEPGWQNPFGFANLDVDDLADDQRNQKRARRRKTVADLQRSVARGQPFTVVAHPDTIHAVRTDRFVEWPSDGLRSPVDLLSLSGRADADTTTLTVAVTDVYPTRNRNPLAVTFRNRGLATDLLYDPLARWTDGELRPWLARNWDWADDDGTVATLELRPDARWHDGRPVTADDVAFTYRFLADTSLGRGDVSVPAPRFRGRIDLVEDVTVVDDHTVRIRFDGHPRVVRRAFTVPVLPEHEWRPRAREAELAGIDLFDGMTEALVWDNPEPVGSGPLAFESAEVDEELVLTRFDDHFSNREGAGVPYDRLLFHVAPSDEVAVELAATGEADATGPVFASVTPRIGRAADLSLLAGTLRAFYHVGYNIRRGPFTNPRFRLAVGKLLDRKALLEETFGGYATPAVSPVGDEWRAADLEWDGSDPVTPFPRTDDGSLDVAAVRQAFREAGHRYREDGTLVT